MLYDPSAAPADVYAAHYAYGRILSNMIPPPEVPFPQSFDPERKLRLGVVSPDLRTHPSHRFLFPVLEHLDRERFDLFLYSTAEKEDAITQTYKPLATQWRSAAMLSVRELARRIHEDRIDVLIDMAGHQQGGRPMAFHLRPAPVQAVWMGYPCTTGIQAMDYRITDSLVDPADFDGQSTEQLIRIDPLFTCYRPPAEAPDIDPTPPSSREGAKGVTFVSFNALQKVNAAVIKAWARALKEVRGSRLVIRHRATLQADVREHLVQRLAQAGASRDAIVVEPPAQNAIDVLRSYRDADIALDTFPYPGITTTCEALWMGVPVVSMEGRTSAARNGLPILHAAGLGDLVAKTEDDFVSIAVKLAADTERRAELRRSLRTRLEQSALRDEKGFTRKFENALRSAWRERCKTVATK
jgi:protein O-GlcNAc transferase